MLLDYCLIVSVIGFIYFIIVTTHIFAVKMQNSEKEDIGKSKKNHTNT